MTTTLDIVGIRRSRAGARLIKGLARARRAIRSRTRGVRRPAVTIAQRQGFEFPDPRDVYARELARLDADNFPMWRPDPQRVRALQAHRA